MVVALACRLARHDIGFFRREHRDIALFRRYMELVLRPFGFGFVVVELVQLEVTIGRCRLMMVEGTVKLVLLLELVECIEDLN